MRKPSDRFYGLDSSTVLKKLVKMTGLHIKHLGTSILVAMLTLLELDNH